MRGEGAPTGHDGAVSTKAKPLYPLHRLNALSDGIFAIALTLLVLELKLPDPVPPGSTIGGLLAGNVHEFLGWIVSFIVLARLWLTHHQVLGEARRGSNMSVVANLAFLGTISLVPFAAHLVGLYDFTEPLSMQIFSGIVLLNALTLAWVVRLAEVESAETPAKVAWSRRVLHHLVVVPILAVLAIVLASYRPGLALAIWAIEAIAIIILLGTAGFGTPSKQTEP